MKITTIPLAVALSITGASVTADDTDLRELANSAGLSPIPYGIQAVDDNPVTREKIELGKMLFFDPRLSASGVISCSGNCGKSRFRPRKNPVSLSRMTGNSASTRSR